jgi:hypothetical protein
MNGSIIGIKLADGSFYPILDESVKASKQLVLTTVRDDQSNVKIDLYRSSEDQALLDTAEEEYIGSLLIENLPASLKGEAEVKLIIGIDEFENLNAEAVDASSGESQSLSISLQESAAGESFEVPDFELGVVDSDFPSFDEDPAPDEMQDEPFDDFSENEPFIDDSEPNLDEEEFSSTESSGAARYNPVLLAVFIVLGLLLIAVIGYVIFRVIQGPEVPPLIGALTGAKAALIPFFLFPCRVLKRNRRR